MADEVRSPEAGGERRGVLGFLIQGFLALWALGAAGVGLAFLRAPTGEGRRESESLVSCGPLAELAVGETRFVRNGPEPLFITRVAGGEVTAMSAICTHMRCILKPDKAGGRFLCPCHAGSFDANGNVLGGPPKRPLTRYRAEVRGGQIVVRL